MHSNEKWKNYSFLRSDELDSLTVYEKVTLCCSNIENMLHFSGIIATALYRDCKMQNTAIEHSIFMSFERGFFGSWLYLSRKIGEYFYDTNHCGFFEKWIQFLKKYGSESDFIELCSELLAFRNDVRHGSASQNAKFVANIVEKLNILHDAFFELIQNYLLSVDSETGSVFMLDGETKLQLSPFVIWNEEKEIFTLQNVGKSKKEFYETFGINYASYIKDKQGDGDTQQKRKKMHFKTVLFDEIRESIKSGKRKLVLWAPPGGGKTYALNHLPFENVCYYNIAESPLKIKPTIALKTFSRHFQNLFIPEEKKINTKSIEENLSFLIKIFKKFPEQQFVIAIDNLFSVFVKDWYQDAWLPILNKEYPENVVWIVSACLGEPIGHFYDTSIDIPKIKQESILMHFNEEATKRAYSYSKGNPKLLWLNLKNPEENTKQYLYFNKWLRAFHVKKWQQKILTYIARQPEAVSVKKIATDLQIFTPKVERFLHEIDILMDITSDGRHLLYHPSLAEYLETI